MNSNDIFSQLSQVEQGKFKPLADEYQVKPWQVVLSVGVLALIGASAIPAIQVNRLEGKAVAQSSEAMMRVRQNPYRGVDAHRREVAFEEGMVVYDASTGQPITADGAFVANKRGDTGEIRGGVLTSVRRVGTADLEQFRQYLKLNERGRTAPGV